jgi:hypothetical protein
LRFFVFLTRGNVPEVALWLNDAQWTVATLLIVSLCSRGGSHEFAWPGKSGGAEMRSDRLLIWALVAGSR